MRNLAVLEEDPLAVYDAIASSKDEPRRSRLGALRSRVGCAYLRYYAHRPALERQQPLGRRISPEEVRDLLHCYDGMSDKGSRAYDRYYARIRALTYYCAYCGIHRARMLDHYLPKAGKRGYPELAVLPANLVPSCGECNPPRDFRDKNGQRSLINPYFDSIRQERLLVAEVGVVAGVPEVEFRVDLSGCIDVEFGRLYERHIRLLDLLKRYRERAMLADDGLARFVDSVRIWAEGMARVEVLARLWEEVKEYERKLGVNHFWAALTRGAATSNALVDFCVGSTS